MSEQKNNPNKQFDLRTLEFDLARGTIDSKEYEAFLKALPDDSENLAELKLDSDDED